MNHESKPQVTRRRVFAGAGAVGALGVAAAALPLSPSAAPEALADAAPKDDEHGRYQATPHVLRYYQTARV